MEDRRRYHDLLTSLPMPLRLFLSLVLLACIVFLDWLSGFDVSFSLFYLLPVLSAGLLISRRAGMAMAILSSVAWAGVDILADHIYSADWMLSWNTSVRLIFLLVTNEFACLVLATYARERERARTDALTGMANTRVFEERIEQVLAETRRDEQPFTLTYIDLDRFKQVNDNFGHQEGDRLLTLVAQSIQREIRETDLAARLGGDEFGILMAHTDPAQARTSLERIATALNEELGGRWGVGATFGAVTFTRAPASVNDAIKLADALMYRGKENAAERILQESWPPPTR